MPIVRKSGNQYIIFCPGCKCAHAVTDAWVFNGNYEKPTFSPSILVNRGKINPTQPICHSFVVDGRIQFLSDCTHDMAGQTVDLDEF